MTNKDDFRVNKYIKLKDLPKDWVLDGRHFKGNKKLKIRSGWNKGLWLQEDGSEQMHPMFFNSFKDIEDKMISLHTHEAIMLKIAEFKEGRK